MDETKMPQDWVQGAGWTMKTSTRYKKSARFKQRVMARQTRCQTTLMGAVCNDANLQKTLPQVILPYDTKDRPLSRAAIDKFNATLHQPVILGRDTNGWVNDQVMTSWLSYMDRWKR